MANQLHLVLKSLCLNTDWDCALFWKLQDGSKMLLTCEDAFYEDQKRYHQPDNMCLDYDRSSLLDRHSHSSLRSAVAMMSNHIHHLGQGVIGEVGVTGKHIWAFADNCFPFETLVAVPVFPYGVVQLGSLRKVPEDFATVRHVRDAFAANPDSSMGSNLRKKHCHEEISSCLSEISARNSAESRVICDCKKTRFTQFPRENCVAEHSNQSCSVPLGGKLSKRTSEAMNMAGRYDISTSMDDESELLHLNSYISVLEQHIQNWSSPKSTDGQIGFCKTEPFGIQIQDFRKEADTIGTLDKPLKFSAGCELYDVVGLSLGQQGRCNDWKASNSETPIQVAEVVENSCISVLDSGSDDLLEAVVANVRRCRTNVRSNKPFDGSQTSLITTEQLSQPSRQNLDVDSVGYSLDHSVVQNERWHCLSSEEWCSSKSQSVQEPEMVTKKRARTGENRKTRPRDRQLIQDRIKELRQIVPSGSKCSIDSLLERTIKHMVYMQNLTKNAEKLKKFTESKIAKLHNEETLVKGLSSCSQGSTWAVEVGTDLKTCPIMIESIDINGLMMIQIVCDDCGYFLEIAETVRSLGLTILKSITKTHGKKTSMQFVVEGQNNKNLQRIDIFWQLLHILQTKSII